MGFYLEDCCVNRATPRMGRFCGLLEPDTTEIIGPRHRNTVSKKLFRRQRESLLSPRVPLATSCICAYIPVSGYQSRLRGDQATPQNSRSGRTILTRAVCAVD